MVRFCLGIITAFALLLASYYGLEAHKWKRIADERGWRADQAYSFLAAPAAKDMAGHTFTNADVIADMVRTHLANGRNPNP